MYALCVSGAVNTQGVVWKFFYALYINFHSFINEVLNKAFEEWDILKALQNLKSNKACGHDQIINEFLKASAGKMTEIYTNIRFSFPVKPQMNGRST